VSGKKLLLHSCCAPCSSAALEKLKRLRDIEVTVFFFNPNVLPESEYRRRLAEQERFLSEIGGVPLIVGEYLPEHFKSIIAGLEHLPENGSRCTKCYELRLGETAKTAVSLGMDEFATTLTLSSKKNAAHLNEVAARCARKYSTRRMWTDFKKDDGYNRSIALCERHNLYRQEYCGCQPPKSPEKPKK
jgi:hypothetical protein